MIKDLIKKTRSIRTFKQKHIDYNLLSDAVDCARYSSSTANIQNIKYLIVNDEENCQKIFPLIKWAGMIDWNPTILESPSAYIVILRDKTISIADNNFNINLGIALQNINLSLAEKGLGTCTIGAYNKRELEAILNVGTPYESALIIGMGEPAEKVELVDCDDINNTKYYRTLEKHYVPKLSLGKIILNFK